MSSLLAMTVVQTNSYDICFIYNSFNSSATSCSLLYNLELIHVYNPHLCMCFPAAAEGPESTRRDFQGTALKVQ